MGPQGRVHVDLLLLPHQGSKRNLTSEFLERLTADNYLFSGDGTHSNPEVATIAALVAARPCADYTMYFVNRDSDITQRPAARSGGARTFTARTSKISSPRRNSTTRDIDASFAPPTTVPSSSIFSTG
jgi:hypothetical protein